MKNDFLPLAVELGTLLNKKNAAYGDSFLKGGKIFELLYPDGIRCDQYIDALAIIRVVDKLFRIATHKKAFGESPWKDICGYALLGATNDATMDAEASAEEEDD
jgi:hypothetical protein